jgi:hypothetical protein
LETVKIKKKKRFGKSFPQVVQVQPGNSSGSNKPDVHGKEKPGVSQGVCVEMEGRGNTYPTPFNRNRDGDFICQYFKSTLLRAFNGQVISTFL